MQLKHLVKPLDQMTDEELLEKLRTVRHNREVARPVAKAKVTTAAKKTSNKKMTIARDLFSDLSEDERLALIKQLGG